MYNGIATGTISNCEHDKYGRYHVGTVAHRHRKNKLVFSHLDVDRWAAEVTEAFANVCMDLDHYFSFSSHNKNVIFNFLFFFLNFHFFFFTITRCKINRRQPVCNEKSIKQFLMCISFDILKFEKKIEWNDLRYYRDGSSIRSLKVWNSRVWITARRITIPNT